MPREACPWCQRFCALDNWCGYSLSTGIGGVQVDKPRITTLPPKGSRETRHDVLRIAYGSENSQFGDLRLPGGAGPHRVAILVHGGVWRSVWHLDLMELLAEDLAARGYATWNIEYRRNGEPGGGWPGTFLDVAQATDFLRTLAPRYHLDLEKVASIGHSAGGHLALWLAGRHRIPRHSPLFTGARPLSLSCVVCQSAVTDLLKFCSDKRFEGDVCTLLGVESADSSDLSERLRCTSPVEMLPLGVPQILVHGVSDPIVSVNFARSYAAKARLAGDVVHLIEFDGGHFEVLYPQVSPWPSALEVIARTIE